MLAVIDDNKVQEKTLEVFKKENFENIELKEPKKSPKILIFGPPLLRCIENLQNKNFIEKYRCFTGAFSVFHEWDSLKLVAYAPKTIAILMNYRFLIT